MRTRSTRATPTASGGSITYALASLPTFWGAEADSALYVLVLLALLLLVLVVVWRVQQRKLRLEEEYIRRLQQEVKRRMAELRERNAELRAANKRLLEASLTDSLTGLRNRRFLFDEVARDIALVRRRYRDLAAGSRGGSSFDLAFMMIDLDHFKAINDGFGHSAGDRVLIELRRLLLEHCRVSDVAIRWGGDEFLVVARDADSGQVESLAERIRAGVEAHAFRLEKGQVVRTTCSIGFACYPFVRSQPDLVGWEQVITLADHALYRAKERRNAWVGFAGAEGLSSGEDLLLSLRHRSEDLVERGVLDLRTGGPVAAVAS